MPEQESTSRQQNGARDFAELFRGLTTGAQPAEPGDGARPGGDGNPPGVPPGAGDVVQFMSQAYIAYLTSGLRYWSRLTEVWAKVLPPLAGGVAEVSTGNASRPEARAVLIDEVRACLRELAEMPQQEARLLQAQLEKIAGALWPEQDKSEDGRYWRRWKAKP